MKATADVVVIGAGVIGCSTAYHLAKMGVRDVAVVEMDQVGGGSSSKSASMLSLQFCPNEIVVQMVRLAFERYMAFEEEDHQAILGLVPSVKGLILSCGWGGMGIILAPVAGQALAEYIAKGYSSTMDIRPFRIERFAMKMG